ncbi:hypothetical protein FRB98_001665 [Tulasnella sp. 332]|nr:hypothetical protein FRB98_001665 [Tulasnella sp. 332]
MTTKPATAYNGDRKAYERGAIVANVCLLSINLICTPLVVVRLWWLARKATTKRTRSLYKVVRLRLIESGSLYTATTIVWVAFTLPNGRWYIGITTFMKCIFSMVLPLSPMLIISHLKQAGPSDMHDDTGLADQQVSEGKTAPETPSSTGLVSTTIAFRPQILTWEGPLESVLSPD